MESIIIELSKDITQFVFKYFVLVFLVITSLAIITFRKPIDYLLMKNDLVWRRWYKSRYMCPSCLKRLKPYDYPPNYICGKCSGIHVFGDRAVKEWGKNKPIMTKGEFIRYLVLLGIFAIGAFYVFKSGII
jgi:hypothetical protein